MLKIKGIVTQEDIDNGKIGECSKCPLALAIDRIFGGKYYISVAPQDILVIDQEPFGSKGTSHGLIQYRGRLSPAMVDFVREFDSQHLVKPCVFEMELEEAHG